MKKKNNSERSEVCLQFVELDLTTECNLWCRHCRTNANLTYRNMTFKTYTSIVDQIQVMGVNNIALSGGEPLLNNRLVKMIAYARSKGLEVHLVTNSTLITEKHARVFKNLHFLHPQGKLRIVTSLDGLEETHDNLRGCKGAFHLCLSGVKHCINQGLEVDVITTLRPDNINEIASLADMAENLGCNVFKVRPIIPLGRARSNPSLSINTEMYFMALSRLVKIKYKKKGSLVVESSDPLWLLADRKLLEGLENSYEIENGSVMGGCSAGIYSLYISAEGWVFPCAYVPCKLGHIRDKPLAEIWVDSPFLKPLRNRNYLQGRCGKCKYRFVCGGCRGRALAISGNLMSEDPLCEKVGEKI